MAEYQTCSGAHGHILRKQARPGYTNQGPEKVVILDSDHSQEGDESSKRNDVKGTTRYEGTASDAASGTIVLSTTPKRSHNDETKPSKRLRTKSYTLQKERDKFQRENERLAARVRFLSRESSEKTDMLQKLREKTEACESKVRHCTEKLVLQQNEIESYKKDLFKSKPPAKRPDTEFVRAYNALCFSVLTWVDKEINRIEVDCQRLEGQQLSGPVLEKPGLKKLLVHYPNMLEHLWAARLHENIRSLLFKPDMLLFGMPQAMESMLLTLTNAMGDFMDPKTINRWRTTAIKAVAAIEGTKQSRLDEYLAVAAQLLDGMVKDFPIFGVHERKVSRLDVDVVSAALKLEHMIHTSRSFYNFGPCGFAEVGQKISMKNLEQTAYTDLESGRKLTSTTPAELLTPVNGFIGRQVFTIEPKLYRVEGDVTITLRHGHHLLQLFHPLKYPKREDTSSAAKQPNTNS